MTIRKKKNETPLFDEKKYNRIIKKLNADLLKLQEFQTSIMSERAEAKAQFEAEQRAKLEADLIAASRALDFPKDEVELTKLAIKLTADPTEIIIEKPAATKTTKPRARKVATSK